MVSTLNKWIVKEYQELLSENEVVVLGMDQVTVEEAEDVRNRVRETGAQVLVTKNRLAKVALKESGIEMPSDAFDGTCALLVGSVENTIAAAKAIDSVWKKASDKKISFRAAWFDGSMMDASQAPAIAKMPDKQTLRGMLAGAIAGPARMLATVLQEVPASTARVIKARADEE